MSAFERVDTMMHGPGARGYRTHLAPTRSMACRNSLKPSFSLLSSSRTRNTRLAVAMPLFRSGNRLVNCSSVSPPGKSF